MNPDLSRLDLEQVRAEVEAGRDDTTAHFADSFASLFDDSGRAALYRAGGPEHLTASCLVLDPDDEAILLHHHRKAGLWGQFGGHLEAEDESLRAAATRESLEESGLHDLRWISEDPIDLHIHSLSRAFGTCSQHYDVVFAAVASVNAATSVSEESLDLGWFNIDELPSPLMPDLVVRLPRLYARGAAAFNSRDRIVHRH